MAKYMYKGVDVAEYIGNRSGDTSSGSYVGFPDSSYKGSSIATYTYEQTQIPGYLVSGAPQTYRARYMLYLYTDLGGTLRNSDTQRGFENQPIPTWCNKIRVLLCGAGGGGGGGGGGIDALYPISNASYRNGGGGAGGNAGAQVAYEIYRDSSSSTTYNVYVGRGGEGGNGGAVHGANDMGGTAGGISYSGAYGGGGSASEINIFGVQVISNGGYGGGPGGGGGSDSYGGARIVQELSSTSNISNTSDTTKNRLIGYVNGSGSAFEYINGGSGTYIYNLSGYGQSGTYLWSGSSGGAGAGSNYSAFRFSGFISNNNISETGHICRGGDGGKGGQSKIYGSSYVGSGLKGGNGSQGCVMIFFFP